MEVIAKRGRACWTGENPLTLEDLWMSHELGNKIFHNTYFLFFKDVIYLFFGEKHLSVASHMPPTSGLDYNPGICPDQESNWQHLSLQGNTQPTEPHQPGLDILCVCLFFRERNEQD